LFTGHIRNLLITSFGFTPTLFQDLSLLVAWSLFLILLGSTAVWRRIKIPELITNFLNVTSWVVILIPLYFVGVFTYQEIQQAKVLNTDLEKENGIFLSHPVEKPDIYVIILDAYGREDFLRSVFSFDNREFVDYLTSRGFYIAEKSQTNFPQTQLSLSTLLNTRYPNEWTKGLEKTNHRGPLTESINHSRVRKALQDIGYQTINIPNSTLIGDLEDSDVLFSPYKTRVNEFEGLVLSTTPLDIFAQRWNLGLNVPGYGTQRRTTEYQLNALKLVPNYPGPKFVFVHILAPHPPFIFNSEGNPVQPDAVYTLGDGAGFPGTRTEYEQGYREQITYLNRQMKDVVDAILENSEKPPIIIIQGDHGPGSRFDMLSLDRVDCLWERFSILNAYYFPGQKYVGLYPTISPVNSFRVIFNTFFGTDLPLLQDKSYYASYGTPYVDEDVTGKIEQSCQVP